MGVLRKGLFSFVLLTYSMICFSQEKAKTETSYVGNTDKKYTVSYFSEIIIGMAVPLGNFGRSDLNNTQSGFAKTGGFLFAGYGKMYNNRIGFEVAISLNVNPLDPKIDQLKKVGNPEEYHHDVGWVIINCLIGPHFSLPMKRFAFDVRILAGLMDARRPSFQNIYYGAYFATLEENVGHGYAFVYQFGAGLRHPISKKVDLKLSIDYFRAAPKIRFDVNGSVKGVDFDNYFEIDEIKYKQPVSVLNIGIGLLLHLD
jgi:hypothetical protein